MKNAICTLFEGSYHFGVAALTNSLHRSGFRGDVYAGYRGAMPPWAKAAQSLAISGWPGASVLAVGEGVRIVFLPLNTHYHLTNYKPDFMLALLDGPAAAHDALFYLDPDICVTHHWHYFEEWVSCGVALCEDLNSPLPENHPRRTGWRRYFGARGLSMRFRGCEYVNGGFVGVRREDRAFIECWQRAMVLMADEVGSLSIGLTSNDKYKSTGFAECFDRTDQDGLNVAIEASTVAASIIGKEAMGFQPGGALIPHALGSAKPWQRNYLRHSLAGFAPRLADRAFWQNVSQPLAPFPRLARHSKGLELLAAAFIGRFFRRA